jgi:hypothetical protein
MNETILMRSDDHSVTLTSHKIRQESKEWGKLQIKSIMLEHVSSCEYNRKSNPIYLILGLLILGFGIFSATIANHLQREFPLIVMAIGAIILIIYIVTIYKRLMVSSSSTKILINTNGMDDDSIKAFINKLEEAKNNRLLK